MKKCLFCEKELTSDMGYITDGKIGVCMLCAGRYTLNEVQLRVMAEGMDANIERVFIPEYVTDGYAVNDENGLTGQTDSAVEYETPYTCDVNQDDGVITPDIQSDIENLSEEDFMSKYPDNPVAIDSYMQFHELGVYADDPDEVEESV